MKSEIDQLKQQGNLKFSEKNFKEALNIYSEAIDLFLSHLESKNIKVPEQLQDGEITRSQLEKSRSVAHALTKSINSVGDALKSFFSNNSQESRDNVKISKMTFDQFKLWLSDNQSIILEIKPQILFSNRSAAFLSLHKVVDFPYLYSQCAHEDAKKAILLDGCWYKSYVRAGEACVQMERFEEALGYYYDGLNCVQQSNTKVTEEFQLKICYVNTRLQNQSENLKIIQFHVGVDIASGDLSLNPVKAAINKFAKQLDNFVYLIVCEVTRKCVVVDICWDIDSILDFIKKMDYNLVGCIVTHQHFDHVGGIPPEPYSKYGVRVDGLSKVLERCGKSVSAYIHKNDVADIVKQNPELIKDQICETFDGFELKLGSTVDIKFIHTPGHTQGSQCLFINKNSLLTGDTLFLNTIGRLDFPESDPKAMFESIVKLRSLIPANNEDVIVYPGHAYGGHYSTLKTVFKNYPPLGARSLQEFVDLFQMF